MTLIVSLPEYRLDLAKAAIRSGVDSVKLHVNVSHRASGNHFGSVESYKNIFRKIRDEFSEPPLTFKDVLSYNTIAQNVDVPVLVPSQRKLELSDIPLLYKAGIKAVMLGAIVIGHTEESITTAISSFRNIIDSL